MIVKMKYVVYNYYCLVICLFLKETETVFLCIYSLMQTFRGIGRTLKRLFKPSIFGSRAYTTSFDFSQPSSRACIRLYKHGKQFLLLYYYEIHFITNVSDRRIRFIKRFDVILTPLSSSSDGNYKRVDLYRDDDV